MSFIHHGGCTENGHGGVDPVLVVDGVQVDRDKHQLEQLRGTNQVRALGSRDQLSTNHGSPGSGGAPWSCRAGRSWRPRPRRWSTPTWVDTGPVRKYFSEARNIFQDTFFRKKNVSMSDTAQPSNIPWNQDRGHMAAIFKRIVVVKMLSSLFCLCVLLFAWATPCRSRVA